MRPILRAPLAVLALAAAAAAAGQTAEDASAPEEAAVTYRHEVLFTVRAQVGRLAPAARATAIEGRLAELPPSAAGDVRVDERPGSSDLYAGSRFVMSVTGPDAAPTGRTRQQLAADYARNLRDALEREAKGRSVRGVLVAVLLTVLATAIFGLALRLANRGFPALYARLRGWQGTRVRTLGVQGMELLSAERATDVLVAAARGLRVVLTVAGSGLYLNAVLGFFPWTHGFARTVFGYVWDAVASVLLGIAGFLPNLVYIALIVFLTRLALKAGRLLADQVKSGRLALPGFYREWADPTYTIARFLVIAFAGVVMFPYLPGSDSSAFRAVSVFLGVLFSLGSTSAVSNVVAGVVLTYMRPFSVGDRVRIAETTGDVIERNLLVVRIRTIKNVEITLSNAMVLGAHMVNYSAAARAGGLVLHTTVTIGYDVPWTRVTELLVTAARGVEGLKDAPAPFVLTTSLDDAYVSYELNAYTDRVQEMAALESRLHAAILDRFHEAGVEIMSPQQATLRRAKGPAIPRGG
ncbi:MAG: mechanosensitive ion channel [Anaeromyxobacter sp.]